MKHFLKLYPKRWRDRYGAEIGAFLERQRLSVAGVLDLVRGAADAHLHPSLASQLVFVPMIGFRPGGTRTLLERAETATDDIHLAIRAVAAMPERTELVVDWEWQRTPVACAAPGTSTESRDIGAPPNRPPSLAAAQDPELSAVLVAGSLALEATSMARQAHSFSSDGWWSLRSMVFPAVPNGTPTPELRVSQGDLRWVVPFRLVPARITATPIAAEATLDGITVRLTGVAEHEDQLVLAVEASAARPIGGVGAPAPAMPILPSGRNFKVQRGTGFEPIVLEDDRGRRSEEVRRHYALRDLPESHMVGETFVQRFSLFFDAPGDDARASAIVVPFVEITDLTPSVVVDLRALPLDVDLGEHRMRVLSADAYPGTDHRLIKIAIAPSTGSPRFVRPAGVHGAPGGSCSWSDTPEPGEPFWMEAPVGDPPLVTFRGAVLCHDGPWRVELPLV
jgi:hypothetical protein